MLKAPPTLEQAPIEMHHLGSGICSQMRLSTGDILSVTVPATIMRSDWRGLGRNTSAPNRAMSKRDVVLAIISIAQQASPKVSGQSADLRAQLKTWSTVVIMKFFSNLFSIYPITIRRLGSHALRPFQTDALIILRRGASSATIQRREREYRANLVSVDAVCDRRTAFIE